MAVDRAPLSVRALEFLVSGKPASLREVAEGVGVGCDLVGRCLRRLGKKESILGTREAVFRFEMRARAKANLAEIRRRISITK